MVHYWSHTHHGYVGAETGILEYDTGSIVVRRSKTNDTLLEPMVHCWSCTLHCYVGAETDIIGYNRGGL